MNNFNAEMSKVVDRFVTDVTALARKQAIETLEASLSIGQSGQRGSRSDMGLGGAKRSSDSIERLGEKFRAFVEKNPGFRIEQINTQLGTTTAELALPIRKLIAAGAIKVRGEKRATTYFAGKKD